MEKAREFYEQEMGRDSGQPLSQSELARRLTDGFPLPQSHISRMQDAVHYLLPIPTLLYAGSAGIRWNGSRCCARPANAPGSGMP